jgi:hypothetical protein
MCAREFTESDFMITVMAIGPDKASRHLFDPTGYIYSRIVEEIAERLISEVELENKNNYLILVDDGVTRGQSAAVSLATHLGLYAQCKFVKTGNGQEELRILEPTQRERDNNKLPRVISAGHLFDTSEFKVIHICLPKTPFLFGDSSTDGLTGNFIAQVCKLFGADISSQVIGVMIIGLQADCRQLTKVNLPEPTSVATIQLALARKVKTLAAAWNGVCRGGGVDDKPPLAVGLIGVPNSTHQATGASANSFTHSRLVVTHLFLLNLV